MLPGAPAHGAAGFVWRLAGFAALGGGAVSSPPFEAFGGEWSLWVYPHGLEREGKLSVPNPNPNPHPHQASSPSSSTPRSRTSPPPSSTTLGS